jgi:hypothetical protein
MLRVWQGRLGSACDAAELSSQYPSSSLGSQSGTTVHLALSAEFSGLAKTPSACSLHETTQ